jgi:signal transduction histidine kinase/streptogramin lyase
MLELDNMMFDNVGNVWFFNFSRAILYRFNLKTRVISAFWAHSYVAIDCIQDSFETFWMGTAYGSVTRFDPHMANFIFIPRNEGFFPDEFAGIKATVIEDITGTNWVVGAKGIFQLINPGNYDNVELLPFTFPDGTSTAIDLISDPDQQLWFLHDSIVLRKYDPIGKTSSIYELNTLRGKLDFGYLEKPHPRRIVMDNTGKIWLHSNFSQLDHFDPSTNELGLVNLREEDKDWVMAFGIAVDQSGYLWVASYDGVCRLNTETFEKKWYRVDPGSGGGLIDNMIHDIIMDPDGNIWCLSMYSGVYKYDRLADEFVHFDPIQSDKGPYFSLFISKDSSLWVSAWKRLLKYDMNTQDLVERTLQSTGHAAEFSQISNGDILMFYDGLYIFPPEFGAYKVPPIVRLSGLSVNETDYRDLMDEPIELSQLKDLKLKHNENFLRFEYVGLTYSNQILNKYRHYLRGADLDTVEAGTRTSADYFNLKPYKYTFWVSACNNSGIWNHEGTSLEIRIFPPWYRSTLAYILYIIFIASGIILYIRWRTWKLVKEKETLESQVSERTQTITQQKEELQTTLDRLEKTQDRLIQSEKFAALGGLVAGVAHEINTPVGISVTAASSLAEETRAMAEKYKTNQISRSDFKEYLNTANQSAKLILANMERTATMVQSFKQVSVDQSTEQKRKFKLKEYFADVIRSLYPKIKQKNIDIQLNIDDKLELNSYPGDFSQIITNLVLNSFVHGFSDKDSGEIQISASDNGNALEILYNDDGKGIRNKDLQMIFDPFFTTDKKLGTGLGLHIVYNIVSQRLNGTIDCHSTIGSGAQFRISVPKN